MKIVNDLLKDADGVSWSLGRISFALSTMIFLVYFVVCIVSFLQDKQVEKLAFLSIPLTGLLTSAYLYIWGRSKDDTKNS